MPVYLWSTRSERSQADVIHREYPAGDWARWWYWQLRDCEGFLLVNITGGRTTNPCYKTQFPVPTSSFSHGLLPLYSFTMAASSVTISGIP